MATTTKTTITRTGFGCGISLEDYFAARNASSSSLGSSSTQHTGPANEFTVLPPFDEAAQYADANRQNVSTCQFVYRVAVMLTGEIRCNS